MSPLPESDSPASVFKSRPQALAALLAAGEERAQLWRADELAAIFHHQIASPLLVDLGGFDPRTARRLKLVSEAQGLLLKSFADLFQHPAPPLELLKLVKDFAKANLDQPDSGLPSAIASVLYYTSIASAVAQLDQRISKLSDAELRQGLTWARDQAWLDDATRALLTRALDKIPAVRKGTEP